MDKKLVGRISSMETKCEMDEEGYWKATTVIVDSVLYKDESEWITETIDAMSIDRNATEATRTAMNSALSFLVDNVYRNGFTGLVEFREYERNRNAKPALADTQVTQD